MEHFCPRAIFLIQFGIPTQKEKQPRCLPASTMMRCMSLLLVKSAVLAMRRLLPVFPDKETFSVFVGMSRKCQRTKPLAR
jgi:hypothetical protein